MYTHTHPDPCVSYVILLYRKQQLMPVHCYIISRYIYCTIGDKKVIEHVIDLFFTHSPASTFPSIQYVYFHIAASSVIQPRQKSLWYILTLDAFSLKMKLLEKIWLDEVVKKWCLTRVVRK